MAVVVMLGQLIHHIQRERDMSVLYLSDLGPGTKTFLLAEYMATDDALQKLTIWPGGLQVCAYLDILKYNKLIETII